MLTCAERAEVIVDFGQYHEGDEVTLYTDDVPLLKFRIHAFKPDQTTLPDKLFDVKAPVVDPALPVPHVVMRGMDEGVAIDGKSLPCGGLMPRNQLAKPSTGMLPIAMMRLEWFIHSMCMEPNS